MKNIVFNLICLVGFLSVGHASSCDPDTKEFREEIKKSFPIENDGSVVLINKYGNINVKSSNGNVVRVFVEIIVNASNDSAAKNVFDRIKITTQGSRSDVLVQTEIESAHSGWNFFTWSWPGSNSDYKINYHIEMPMTCHLTVENKYGNIAIEDFIGPVHVNAKYGNLDMGNVSNDVHVDVKYGNASIGDIIGDLFLDAGYSNTLEVGNTKRSRAQISYSNLNLLGAEEFDLESKYSKISSDKLGYVQYEGKYDKLDFGGVYEISGITKYTGINIGELIQALFLENAYGHLVVDRVSSDCKDIEVSASYMPIELQLARGLGYEIDVESSYSKIDIPLSELKILSQDYELNEKNLKGIKGNGNCKILIDINHGRLKIK